MIREVSHFGFLCIIRYINTKKARNTRSQILSNALSILNNNKQSLGKFTEYELIVWANICSTQ